MSKVIYTVLGTVNTGETLNAPVEAESADEALRIGRKRYPQARNLRLQAVKLGRPMVGPMISTRLEPKLLDRVDALAEKRDATRAQTIRDLVAAGLETVA